MKSDTYTLPQTPTLSGRRLLLGAAAMATSAALAAVADFPNGQETLTIAGIAAAASFVILGPSLTLRLSQRKTEISGDEFLERIRTGRIAAAVEMIHSSPKAVQQFVQSREVYSAILCSDSRVSLRLLEELDNNRITFPIVNPSRVFSWSPVSSEVKIDLATRTQRQAPVEFASAFKNPQTIRELLKTRDPSLVAGILPLLQTVEEPYVPSAPMLARAASDFPELLMILASTAPACILEKIDFNAVGIELCELSCSSDIFGTDKAKIVQQLADNTESLEQLSKKRLASMALGISETESVDAATRSITGRFRSVC